MIGMIGDGDAKSVLLNFAEQVEPNDKVIILVRRPDSTYRYSCNTIPFEILSGILVIFTGMVQRVSKGEKP